MWSRLGLLWIFLVLLSACKESDKTAVYHAPEKPALALEIVSVSQKDIPRYYSATGYTSIARTIEISTSQSGTIKKLNVSEGDSVNAGALLIEIDESELITSIKQAKSAIKSATINLKDSQYDFDTSKRLIQSKVITTEQLRKSQVQLDLAKSQLAQKKSELKRLQARKPYYRMTSPIAARVVKRWISQGDLAVVGKPLLRLEAIKGLEFETALPTQWIDQIHVGDRYQLKIHNANKPVAATVSHIIHRTHRVTQTCQIKLALPDSVNKNKLTAGLSGEIDFIVAHEKQLLIPESSLIKKAGVVGVFRVNKENKARFTPVKTERSWQHQRVILSGLNKDERVVLKPFSSLRDGTLITVTAK